MINVVIYNICKTNVYTEKLLSMCEKNIYIDKIFFITSPDKFFPDFDSNKIEVVFSSFGEGINKVIFDVCNKIAEGFIAVIPDTFLFSDKILDYIYAESSLSSNKLYILGKENNLIINEKVDFDPNESYKIYSLYEQEPSDEDYASCLFFGCNVFEETKQHLEKALSLKSHFFTRYFSLICLNHSYKVVYPVNERLYFCNDVSLPQNKKQDSDLAKNLGIIPSLNLSIFQKIFSITEFNKHSVLTFLGLSIPFKYKKKPNFGKNSTEFSYISRRVRFDTCRACVFAGFTAKGKVSDNELSFLKSLSHHVDYLVYVADSLADEMTIRHLKQHCDAVIIKRHNEYDFGSYKRGYELLLKEDILSSFDCLLLCNDSVDFVGNDDDLSDIFKKARMYDAYSLCTSTYGFGDKIKKHKYLWIKSPHLQSYFVILNKKVFTDKDFSEFLLSVKHHKHKTEIIKKYEMGLSEFLRNKSFTMGSYYPYDDTNIVNPYAIYMSPNYEHPLFVKHMLLK